MFMPQQLMLQSTIAIALAIVGKKKHQQGYQKLLQNYMTITAAATTTTTTTVIYHIMIPAVIYVSVYLSESMHESNRIETDGGSLSMGTCARDINKLCKQFRVYFDI